MGRGCAGGEERDSPKLGKGNFYRPTVAGPDVTAGYAGLWQERDIRPGCFAIMPFDGGRMKAVRLANDSEIRLVPPSILGLEDSKARRNSWARPKSNAGDRGW